MVDSMVDFHSLIQVVISCENALEIVISLHFMV